jgi:hypothetical protein
MDVDELKLESLSNAQYLVLMACAIRISFAFQNTPGQVVEIQVNIQYPSEWPSVEVQRGRHLYSGDR